MVFSTTGEALSASRQPAPVPGHLSTADADARRLAADVARGSEAAFRDLYDRYHDRLFRLALLLGRGDETLAGDVVQSTFVTTAARLHRVESEEHLWNWLARVTRQHFAKVWRARRLDSKVVGLADVPELAGPDALDPVFEDKLDAALQAMEPDERQIIEWFYFDGLSHKEIAARLATTPKAVSSRMERVRARLRLLLHRSLSDES